MSRGFINMFTENLLNQTKDFRYFIRNLSLTTNRQDKSNIQESSQLYRGSNVTQFPLGRFWADLWEVNSFLNTSLFPLC